MNNLADIDWNRLPRPTDDLGAMHLAGMAVPSLVLRSTGGKDVRLSDETGINVVFVYPMTGRPDVELPQGWDSIPGARGCTPQSCAFRDMHGDLIKAGAKSIFDLSTQTTDYQREAAQRLHLSYPLLSDANDELTKALNLPTMEVEGMTMLKRLTMIIKMV